MARYAAETERYGTIHTAYRRKLWDSFVCPGDMAVLEARHPRADLSSKNAIKLLRGSRFFDAVSKRAGAKPRALLAGVAERLIHWEKKRDAEEEDEEEQRQLQHDERSEAIVEEEFAALCTIAALVRGRYGLDWSARFLVTRGSYHVSRARDGTGRRRMALPTVFVARNTYDVCYRGAVLRTTSLFESFAWWLAIMRTDHRSSLVVTNAGGVRRTMSIHELSSAEAEGESPVVWAQRGMNIDSMPSSAIVGVNLTDLCAIVVDGETSFVPRAGDTVGYTFSSIATVEAEDDRPDGDGVGRRRHHVDVVSM